MRIYVGLILLFFALMAVAPLGAEDRPRIGATSALTGPAATYGTDIKNLLQFANRELANNQYEIIVEDDKCNPKEAVTIAHRFISFEKLPYVIGFPCSGTTLAVAPLFEKAKVLLMTYGSAPAISQAGDYIFRTRISDEFGARLLLNYIKPRHKKLGLIIEQTDYAVDTARAFKNANREEDSPLYLQEESYISETDLRPILLKLKNLDVDGIFIVIQTELTMINALKQLKELNIRIPVYGSNVADSDTLLKTAGESAEGLVVFGQPEVPDSLSAEGKKLYEKFILEYGEMRGMKLLFLTAMLAFDATHRAISSGEDVKSYLYAHEFGGVFGKFSFDKNGDISGLPFVLKKVEKSRFQTMR